MVHYIMIMYSVSLLMLGPETSAPPDGHPSMTNGRRGAGIMIQVLFMFSHDQAKIDGDTL